MPGNKRQPKKGRANMSTQFHVTCLSDHASFYRVLTPAFGLPWDSSEFFSRINAVLRIFLGSVTKFPRHEKGTRVRVPRLFV
jgi:hypothetical protein